MKNSIINYFTSLIYKKSIAYILIIIYLILSYFHIKTTYNNSIRESSNFSLHIAATIENSLKIEDLKQLKAIESDINLLVYKDIKSKLIALRKINHNAKFIYFLKQSENRIYFMADSEPENSSDYSAPGDEYMNETDQEIYIPFRTGKTILTKPTTDKWGTWISVLTPIKDPTTGKIIAVMGIDYAANEWFNSAKSAAIQ
ncbi:MAG: hypothetical protein ACOYM7_02120, partial [Paludibacter sp.]